MLTKIGFQTTICRLVCIFVKQLFLENINKQCSMKQIILALSKQLFPIVLIIITVIILIKIQIYSTLYTIYLSRYINQFHSI